MKKVLAVVMALVFALTMIVAFAEHPATKPAEPAKKAEPAKGAVKSIKSEVSAVRVFKKTQNKG